MLSLSVHRIIDTSGIECSGERPPASPAKVPVDVDDFGQVFE